jgi:hypothetical protein
MEDYVKRLGVAFAILLAAFLSTGLNIAGASKSSQFHPTCAASAPQTRASEQACVISTKVIQYHSAKGHVPKVGKIFINHSTTSPADDIGYGTSSLLVDSTGSGYAIYDATGGFQVSPTITTFTATGKELATITPGLAYSQFSFLSHPATGGIVLALNEKSHPAQGLTPASQSFTFTAWSVNSGKKMWTTPNFAGQGSNDFVETSNGLYATAYFHQQYASIITLSTGAISNPKILDQGTVGAVGNFIDVQTCINNPVGGFDLERLVNPSSGSTVSSFQAGTDNCEAIGPTPAADTLNLGEINLVLNGNSPNTGLFQNISFSNVSDGYADSGFSPNGSTLFVDGQTPLGDCCVLSAYSLPSMRQLWKTSDMVKMIGDDGGVLVGLQLVFKTGDEYFVGINDTTGSILWKQPAPTDSGDLQVCAITATETLVVANNQLIGLNLLTGHQLWYANNDDVTCGNMLTGGAAYYFGSGVTLKQILTP